MRALNPPSAPVVSRTDPRPQRVADRASASLLTVLLLMFLGRVLGQFLALALEPAVLPRFEAWYSGEVPYALLLPAQILLLMIMSIMAWDRFDPHPRLAPREARTRLMLRRIALVYFTIMLVRLGWHVYEHGPDFYEQGAIPVAFHWVLALFLMIWAREPETQPVR